MSNAILSLVMALAVVIIGLYSVAFRNSAASWAAGLYKGNASSSINEKVYTTCFGVVGVSLMAFGMLTVLLVA
ncbi:MAG: hypothetical protein WC512_01935 [Candidatus Omnitrophota bacterium]|jgi:hypothetical protein